MDTLLSALVPNTQKPGRQWVYVTRRFEAIQRNIALQQPEVEDGHTKLRGVVASLNRAFWSETSLHHAIVAGSWGKNTAIRPPSDIDLFFLLPIDIFHQFNIRADNGQSQLLQHVREALRITYPQTVIRGDGQVVVVGFNSIEIEVVPAFPAQGGGYLICDTNGGGSWKRVNPVAKIDDLTNADHSFHGNVRKITRILKQWKRHCDVPIKSFHIEVLVREALSKVDYGFRDEFWFDWIVRDVLLHMCGRAGGGFFMPGGYAEWVAFGDDWQSKAWSAYKHAFAACNDERANRNLSAGTEWQKIFGLAIPEMVI